MTKRMVVVLSLAVLLAGFLALTSTHVASAQAVSSAHPVQHSIANSCQDVTAQLELHGLWTSHYYQCTGIHWVNDAIYFFAAGGWSGYLVTTAGIYKRFCDGQEWYIFPVTIPVSYVYMSPTREPWC